MFLRILISCIINYLNTSLFCEPLNLFIKAALGFVNPRRPRKPSFLDLLECVDLLDQGIAVFLHVGVVYGFAAIDEDLLFLNGQVVDLDSLAAKFIHRGDVLLDQDIALEDLGFVDDAADDLAGPASRTY